MNTEDQLSRTEHALILAIGISAIRRMGEVVNELGFEKPNQEQKNTMFQKAERVLTEVVIGLRAQGPRVQAQEFDVVIDEVATAAVRSVLGPQDAELPN
jgi:hypothetical protein